MLQFFRLLTDSLGHGPILLFLDCVFVHASVEFRTAAKREFSHAHRFHSCWPRGHSLQLFVVTLKKLFKSRLLASCTESIMCSRACTQEQRRHQPQGQRAENHGAHLRPSRHHQPTATLTLACPHFLVPREELTQVLADAEAVNPNS